MRATRREFLAGSSAGTLALAGLAHAAPSGPIPILDTHQHLWDRERVSVPWTRGAGHLDRSFLPADYLEAIAGLGFAASVYMEVDVEPTRVEQEKEAAYVLDLCRTGKRFPCAAVIGGNPGAPDFADYISARKASPFVKGVRCIPRARAGGAHPFLDEAFVRGVRLLGELGLSFDLCVGPNELELAARLVDACPETRFVLDHCGNADPRWHSHGLPGAEEWRRGLSALAGRKPVICKISGIVARADKASWRPAHLAPIVEHCLDAFGPDRVVFGSDWPVCTNVATVRQWVEALREIIAPRPATEQRKLLHDNAVRFYGLGA